MPKATNKKVGFFSQQHLQILWCLMPLKFHCIKI